MKKNEITEDEKKIAEAFAKMYENCMDSTKSLATFYDKQKKMYLEMIENHYEIEPFKIFKKKHKEWEDRLLELEKSYNEAHENFMFEMKDLESLMNF